MMPSPTTDRQCARRTTDCGRSAYMTQAATATSDAVCAPLTNCTTQEFLLQEGTAAADRECRALTRCQLGLSFETVPPTAANPPTPAFLFLSDRKWHSLHPSSRGLCGGGSSGVHSDRRLGMGQGSAATSLCARGMSLWPWRPR